MEKLKQYISNTISATFFPIFLSLFTITSVVYLVKIASLTSVITINFSELLYLYSLSMPTILYFSLPITFFIAIILNLSKLSSEYELIVISSFGMSPMKLVRVIFPITFFMSIALFIIGFIVIPKTDYLQAKFINQKQQEAQFNIKPSEYGQVFGPWHIYVEGKIKDQYRDITLFMPTKDKDTFVTAKNANIENNHNIMKLNLQNGIAMNIMDKNMQQIDFELMSLGYQLAEAKKISTINDIIEYWNKTETDDSIKRMFIRNILIGLLPIISVFFFIGLGFYNPRYQKNKNTIYAIILVTIYMITFDKIALSKDFNNMYIFLVIWIIVSYTIYKIRIKPYY